MVNLIHSANGSKSTATCDVDPHLPEAPPELLLKDVSELAKLLADETR
jgi:hypothetical protein